MCGIPEQHLLGVDTGISRPQAAGHISRQRRGQPLGNDQPGVAARVAAHQAGIVVPRRKLTVERLRSAVVVVLSNETYRAAARRLQIAMQQIDGLEQASKIIEQALKIGIAVDARSP